MPLQLLYGIGTSKKHKIVFTLYNSSLKPTIDIISNNITAMATRVLIINGPNLNLLGTREPQIYGSTTLADVLSTAESQARSLGVTLESFQSNHEGAIVDRIQEAAGFGPNGHQNKDGKVSAIIINPGAYTHTSVA